MARSPTPSKSATTSVLSVKVTLDYIRPPIWRRVIVPGTFTLGDLHIAIQSAMGWHGGHMHLFKVGNRIYGDASEGDIADQDRITLNALVKTGVNRFVYVYDMGDNWEHAILIEKRPAKIEAGPPPVCVAGQRACPPEDCGGVWGYENLIEALADPNHPEHEELSEWMDGDFDPENFDIEVQNRIMRARFGAA